MKVLEKYASFIKLEHTLFSIPLLFAGAYCAGQEWPSFRVTTLVVLAAVAARVVAMTLNRIIDKNIDAKNPRTQERHLPSGKMAIWEAWATVALGMFVYLLAAWLLSDFCLRMSWLPIAAFAAYPYFKRFTKWTHLGLGLVWSLVPVAGFFAVKTSVEGFFPAAMLGVFCIFWLAGFDIIYATLDEEFDRENGVFSLPAAWGVPRALRASGWFHGLAFLALLILYTAWFSGPVTVMILAVIGILLYLEQAFSQYVDLAFFQLNVVIGFAVFLFVVSGIKGV